MKFDLEFLTQVGVDAAVSLTVVAIAAGIFCAAKAIHNLIKRKERAEAYINHDYLRDEEHTKNKNLWSEQKPNPNSLPHEKMVYGQLPGRLFSPDGTPIKEKEALNNVGLSQNKEFIPPLEARFSDSSDGSANSESDSEGLYVKPTGRGGSK